jgi:DNA (cytosine-5)-methyltransferase 1
VNALSLCSGIGAFDLGLERAGMTTVGQVERDPYCQLVLAKHWPEVPKHDDVNTTVEWWESKERPDPDLIVAGFPCQPVSHAGARAGEDDDRWLWPAVDHVIGALRPEWVVFENVPGLRTMGLGTVLADLDQRGYRVRVGTLSACAVGAPHTRERLFGVAHAPRFRRKRGRGPGPAPQGLEHEGRRQEPRRSWAAEPRPHGVAYGVANRMDRLKAIGNAVVPAVGECIGQLILDADVAVAA